MIKAGVLEGVNLPQWQIGNFPGGGIFLLGGENLRRDDCDYLNLLQS